MKESRQRSFPIKTLMVCITVIILALIGSWVYVQKQSIAQKDRQAKAQQAEEIKKAKFEQCNITQRQIYADPKFASNILVKNCDLIL